MKIRFLPLRILLLGTFGIFILGCASMDLRVDVIRLSNDYGVIEPRVEPNCSYYNRGANEPDPSSYYSMAKYVVQENPTVMMSKTPNQMICHLYETAIENGADAIIVDEISTTNVAGGYARTSAIIKATAIRFKGNPPGK